MDYLLFIICAFAIVLIIFIEGAMREKKNRHIYRNWLKESFGKANKEALSAEAIGNISLYHEAQALKDPDRFYIDAITWHDLSMDDIFSDMDTCSSILGEEQLYHRLHCPVLTGDDGSYDHFVKLGVHFAASEDERIRVQEILHDIGINRKTSFTKVFDYIKNLEAESNTQHYMIVLLMLISIVMVFVFPGLGVIMLVAAMIISIGTYLRKKKAIDPVIVTFNYTAKMLKAIEKLNKAAIPELSGDLDILNEAKVPLKGIMSKSVWLTSGTVSMDNPAMLLEEYIKMFFHIDLIMINRMIVKLKQEADSIDTIRDVLGNIDASIAAASYRLSLAESCRPDFAQGGRAFLTVEDCVHPLISSPVANSIDAQGPVLLTGSNASGKSTFLKTVAISALFAQTLGYVPAAKYRGSRFKIYTSMALNDSILNGESYFIVEIKSIKRILDAGDDGIPVLCCIDEVLRGTNTVERIAASTQILKSLTGDNYVPFAATHDIELTHLLEEQYANYHFEEEVTADDVKFNYRLKEGRAQSRNAIRLLQVMDYDQRIIDIADAMVEAFIDKGTWEKD